jgi:hypothetical protein
MIRWHDVHRRVLLGVSSGYTGIIHCHNVHRRLCYWGQLRSYRYYTPARRTSSTALLGSAQVIQVLYAGTTYGSLTVLLVSDRVIQISYAGTTCTLLTVLFASARIIQVWYPGTTYASLTVIAVSSGHTSIICCHDVHRRLCYWVSSGHTGIMRWHNVCIVDCLIGVSSGHTGSIC